MQNNEIRPATEKQINLLNELGYSGATPAEYLSMEEASQYISILMAERKEASATNPQPTATPPQPRQKEPKQEQGYQPPVTASTENKVALVKEKNISDSVINQINVLTETQGLILPPNYSVTNALKMAYLKLAENNLLETDQTALAQALLNMCIQGLNPAKNQCYFINYAGKVNLMRSYFGDRAVAINTGLVKDIQANIIYEGDEVNVTYIDDLMHVEHKTSWQNFSKKIVGAYAFAIMPDGTRRYDIMDIDRIKKSWAMSKNSTNNKLQQNFTDDACKRTVIRHLVKYLFNSTSDQNLVVDAFNNSTADEYVNEEYESNNIEAVNQKQKNQNASITPDIEYTADDLD